VLQFLLLKNLSSAAAAVIWRPSAEAVISGINATFTPNLGLESQNICEEGLKVLQ